MSYGNVKWQIYLFQDEDILIESEEEIIHDSGDHEHVQHLRAKKEELEKRVKEKTQQQENIKVHFAMHQSFVILAPKRPGKPKT